MRSNQTRGFTLVELLMTFVIVVLLIAMLFPWTHSRGMMDAARKTHCLHNLKEIGQAMKMYSQTYSWATFPAAKTALDTPDIRAEQLGLLYDYGNGMIPEQNGFQCPSAGDITPVGSGTIDTADELSYDWIGIKTMLDGSKHASWFLAWDRPGNHKDGQNCLYMDGHVKWAAAGTAPAPASNGTVGNTATTAGVSTGVTP